MNPFLLGMRLLWRGGRRGRVRFLLMTFGCSLGVACLAAVLTIPAILAAHDERSAARQPRSNYERTEGWSTADTIAISRADAYGSQPLHRIFVARPETGPAPVPPGIDRLPAAGEVIVSPRLREVLTESPGVAGLLPGRVSGTIGPDGLAGPDDLFAYVGTTHAQIPEEGAQRVDSFGSRYATHEVVEQSTLDILRFTLACVVLLPLVVFLSVCARLSAESRARRLAALRLVGLSVKDTLRVNAGETVSAAFIGALLGIGGYLVVNEIMARVGLPGLHWYPADGRPEGSTLVACLVLCPALAWFVGRHSARAAARTPLNVRRTAERKPPKMYGTLLLVPGLGVIAGYCALSVMGRDPSGGSSNTVLIPAAVLLTGAGLVFGLPPITAWLARRLAAGARSLPLSLAMRRTEVEPGASLRVVTGLVLLVYATSLTQGVLVELSQVSRNTAPVQEYKIGLAELTSQQRDRMTKAEGVTSHGFDAPSWAPSGTDHPGIDATIATCTQLAAFSKASSGCVEGRVVRLARPGNPLSEYVQPGASFQILLDNGAKLTVAIPHDVLTAHTYESYDLSAADILIPPSLLPPGTLPADGHLVLASASDPGTVRTVLDGIGAIAPTAEVQPVGVVVESLAQLTVIRSLLGAGMVLGLVISVAAFVVSVADRAMERRGQVAALVLLGARAGTLRVVQCVQVVVPLGVGLGAAVVTGWLAESSYLITGGGAVHWDWSGLPLLLACCLGVLLAAGVSALPLVRRHVDPEHIRRD
ncbi:FtsX-like permease family protein [Streptomyces sp. NPDC047981]|uniref:FtsX-like permease family protein n=1 Tax=Streptomyces sp. NPDC047981 TaxID=3154610 RepID=UPI0034409902